MANGLVGTGFHISVPVSTKSGILKATTPSSLSLTNL